MKKTKNFLWLQFNSKFWVNHNLEDESKLIYMQILYRKKIFLGTENLIRHKKFFEFSLGNGEKQELTLFCWIVIIVDDYYTERKNNF